MPRFGVTFGRRKSTADNFPENGSLAEHSFRVLERSEVSVPGKSFDGGARLASKSNMVPKTTVADVSVMEDNMFADLKTNRYVNPDTLFLFFFLFGLMVLCVYPVPVAVTSQVGARKGAPVSMPGAGLFRAVHEVAGCGCIVFQQKFVL